MLALSKNNANTDGKEKGGRIFLQPSIKQRTSAAIRATTTRTGASRSLNEENLVIDEEPDFNLAIKISLEDKGFKVDTLNDPLVALDNFRRIL